VAPQRSMPRPCASTRPTQGARSTARLYIIGSNVPKSYVDPTKDPRSTFLGGVANISIELSADFERATQFALIRGRQLAQDDRTGPDGMAVMLRPLLAPQAQVQRRFPS